MRKFVALLCLMTSCQLVLAGSVSVVDAWSRAMPPGTRNLAVYLTVDNQGIEPARLQAARSPLAERVEVHEHQHVDGMMRMRRVDDFAVPAASRVAFEPGGYHLMLFGVSRVPAPGERFTVELSFDDGSAVTTDVQVRPLEVGS